MYASRKKVMIGLKLNKVLVSLSVIYVSGASIQINVRLEMIDLLKSKFHTYNLNISTFRLLLSQLNSLSLHDQGIDANQKESPKKEETQPPKRQS